MHMHMHIHRYWHFMQHIFLDLLYNIIWYLHVINVSEIVWVWVWMCLCLCNCLINISSIEENVSFIWKVLAAVHWSIMCSHFYISAWHCPCCLLYSGAVCACVCVCIIECVNEYPATTKKTYINFHHHHYTAISCIRNSMINYNNNKYAHVSVLFLYTHIHTCTHKRVN